MLVILLGIVCAVIGILIGFVLRSGAFIGYGLGSDYARHYLKQEGVEIEEEEKRWNS